MWNLNKTLLNNVIKNEKGNWKYLVTNTTHQNGYDMQLMIRGKLLKLKVHIIKSNYLGQIQPPSSHWEKIKDIK